MVVDKRFPRWQRRRRWWLHYCLPHYFPRYNPYLFSLEQSFQLWEKYSQRADQHIASLPPARTRTICYETFLQDPLPVLEDLCAFIPLNVSSGDLQAAASTIDPSRGFAYRRNPELVRFYESVKQSPQMMNYGYV